MQQVYLGIGTNMGQRRKHIQKALYFVERLLGTIITQSSIYETEPWGIHDQPDFLNMVIGVETYQNPQNVLSTVLAIEKLMGRVRGEKWNTRLIDIDILFYGDWVVEEEQLVIPHPYIAERNFVLVPLHEIAPHLIHPVLKTSIKKLFDNCDDALDCKKTRM